MQNQPLVTVYIPTFNRVELLKRAVKSVQDQTYQNLEIIIVDDCSTDGTHKYLERVSKEDSRVRYFLKETNSGACESRNIAIENAKGEFITGLDDDDYFGDERIDGFIKNYKKNNVKIQTSLYVEICSRDKKITTKRRYRFITKEHLVIDNYIGNQIFIHKTMKNFFYFNKDIKIMQDLECWFRLLNNSGENVYCVNSPTYYIDKTHPHERITKKNPLEACKTVCELSKYLNFFQNIIIKNYIQSYGGKRSFFLKIMKRFYRLYLDFKEN